MKTDFSPTLAPFILPAADSWPETRHQFDQESVWAIRAALAAQRPLLIRGEPGIGKSQLARGAAHELGVPFLSHVVHERCEVGDLLYSVDAVSRLAQAQVSGARKEGEDEWKGALAEERFIKPGVFWWALNWVSAAEQTRRYFRSLEARRAPSSWHPASGGCVVLIDEIDKADTSVPNALLETLGNLGFQVPETGQFVARDPAAAAPLVIVTTNEERELPPAFLRRCLVLQMPFPPAGMSPEEFLRQRARAHFSPQQVPEEVCDEAIRQLLADRGDLKTHGLARPGVAELLDLLRALDELHRGDAAGQREALEHIRNFALRKNVAEEGM